VAAGRLAAGEPELETLREHYCRLVRLAKRAERITESHSVEEAERRHSLKAKQRGS
jgi:hypothetical protein